MALNKMFHLLKYLRIAIDKVRLITAIAIVGFLSENKIIIH